MQTLHAPHISASTAKATALVLGSAVCFGSISVLTVFAVRDGMEILNLVFWRFVIASAALFVVAHAPIRAQWRAGLPLFAAGGIMQAMVTYASLSALRFIPASVVAFLFFTYPAWLALGGAARGTEPLTLKRTTILLIAMTGVALMIGIPGVGSRTHLSAVGILLGLGSAVLYSIYLPIINGMQRDLSPLAAPFYIMFGALVTYLVAGLLLSPPWSSGGELPASLAAPATALSWTYVLIFAIGFTVIPFIGLMNAMRTLGAARTSIIATAEPFFTTLLAAVLLGERLRWTTLVGGACIAAAVVAIAVEKDSLSGPTQ